MSRACPHRSLMVHTERDRCSWVECYMCAKTGPKKHSIVMAVLAWLVQVGDQHPRKKRKTLGKANKAR